MTALTTGQLALQLSDVSEQDRRRLASLIAEGLAHTSSQLEGILTLDTLHISLPVSANADIDLLASHYITDATAFWELCDVNNMMIPDALVASRLIGIPGQE